MKALVILLSVGAGIAAFAGMATIGAGPSIDFKTATIEERQAWMDGQKKVITKAAKWFLPSGRGPSELNFYLKDVINRSDVGEMELKIDVRVPYGATVRKIPRTKFLDSFCKSYVDTALYRQGVKLVANFNHQGKGKRIARIKVSPSDCRWAAKKA